MNKLFITIGLCILLVSCGQGKPTEEDTGVRHREDTVYVADNSTVNSKLKLYTVAEQDYSAELNTTGIVKAITGQLAEIAPPFDGRVTKSFVQLGQKINAGAPVFELHSAEFFEAVKSYYQTLQSKKMKESNLHRQKDLVKNGVGVAKEQEEAETDYEMALRDYESAEANLKMLNIDPSGISMGQALKVVSPIAGEVVETNMVIGQYVKSDATPLAVVAELSKVWVVAQVKEKDINAIRTDDKVEVFTEADSGNKVIGHVSHISELLDEETRSVQVLITCDNQDRKLKPGMFASIHFIAEPAPSILIPAASLLQRDDDSYVMLQEGKGTYVRRRVKVSTANRQELVVRDGLHAGDVVVAEGGIYLMPD